MRFLADENVLGAIVASLRERGHDVGWVAEDAPGARDEVVAARARYERRILLTFDKDLAGRIRTPVILVRLRDAPVVMARAVVNAIESRDDWSEHRSVIDARGIRMRGLKRRKG